MPFHTTMSAVLPAAASFAQALHALHHAHDPRAAIAPPQPGALAAGADTSSLSPTDAAALGPRPGKRPAARGTSFYPRKRANTACQVCRARKTKCDNSKPSCSYCLSVGATCIQSPADLSSFDPASLKILDRLDDLERLFRESATSTTASNLNSVDPASNAWHPPDITRRMSSNSHGRPKEIEPFTKGDGPGLGSILPLRVDHVLQWPLFNEQGQHEPLYRLPPAAISTPSAAPSALAGLVDMESYNIYQLLDRFFLYIHCKNPILDETSTRRLVGNAFLNGIDWSPASCLAMVICALGSVATPFGNSHEVKPGSQAYQDSQVFFHAAQKRIGIMLMSSDLVGAQCLFLSGVYMMMVFQPIYAWRYFSQALAACQHFPFLTRAQYMSGGSESSLDSMEMDRQDTQEQAVYWSAWNRSGSSEMNLTYQTLTLFTQEARSIHHSSQRRQSHPRNPLRAPIRRHNGLKALGYFTWQRYRYEG